jgi:phosphoribosylformylglycinamidine synthase subunit PurQ / glutaminase
MRPRALILHAEGTNRDHEAARALEMAGAAPEIITLYELRTSGHSWLTYQLLVIPGGFSYADALGAGRLLSLDLKTYFADEVRAFVDAGRPVVGICNGFQALVKAGLLPGVQVAQPAAAGQAGGRAAKPPQAAAPGSAPWATLTFNSSGRFECRWVTLLPQSSICLWTSGLEEPIYCPVAHGEGNFVAAAGDGIAGLMARDQLALVYAGGDGRPAAGRYPDNPNGSAGDIAGICNPEGNVLGLMPHPEDHIVSYQHPRWTRGEKGGLGLPLFVNGVRRAQEA